MNASRAFPGSFQRKTRLCASERRCSPAIPVHIRMAHASQITRKTWIPSRTSFNDIQSYIVMDRISCNQREVSPDTSETFSKNPLPSVFATANAQPMIRCDSASISDRFAFIPGLFAFFALKPCFLRCCSQRVAKGLTTPCWPSSTHRLGGPIDQNPCAGDWLGRRSASRGRPGRVADRTQCS